MADFTIGTKQSERPAVDTTTTWREASPLTGDKLTGKSNAKDALSVSSQLVQTSAFKRTMENPLARKEFMQAIELKQEMALNRGDKTMFAVFGNLLNVVKQEENKKDISSTFSDNTSTSGRTFDSANLFGIA